MYVGMIVEHHEEAVLEGSDVPPGARDRRSLHTLVEQSSDRMTHRLTLPLSILVGFVAGAAPMTVTLIIFSPAVLGPPPVVSLGNATEASDSYVVDVMRADPFRPLREFRASLLQNGLEAAAIDSLSAPSSGALGFEDRAGLGALSSGDRFTVPLSMQTERYEIRLEWRDELITTATWDIVAPAVTFAPPVVWDNRVSVSVSSASPPAPLPEFFASLWRGPFSLGWIKPLRDLSEGDPLAFADADGDAMLSAGDVFTSYLMDPDSSAGSIELLLYWRGNHIGQVTVSPTAPVVEVSFSRAGPTTFWFNITGSNPPHGCSQYIASIYHDENSLDQLDSLCGEDSWNGWMTFLDLDVDDRVSIGDRLVVETTSAGDWRLWLSWITMPVLERQWTS